MRFRYYCRKEDIENFNVNFVETKDGKMLEYSFVATDEDGPPSYDYYLVYETNDYANVTILPSVPMLNTW